MRRYGQFCPVAKTAEIFCTRWTALILRNILWGPNASATFIAVCR